MSFAPPLRRALGRLGALHQIALQNQRDELAERAPLGIGLSLQGIAH